MKKVYIILFMLIFCTFAIPIIFTKNTVSGKIQNDTNEIKENTLEEIQMIDYDYKQYDTIKLLHADTGEIEELPLDTYLLGVVSAEMPANFEQEALNAQALVARTYTIYSIVHNKENMEMQIYVMTQVVAKHGFLKKIEWQGGMKLKERIIGEK